MFNLKELIAYLKANKISMASADEVRRGLISNEWAHDDIETALVVLESGGVFAKPDPVMVVNGVDSPSSQPTTNFGGLHTSKRAAVLHRIKTDGKLDAASITSLLGVDVNFSDESKEVRRVLRTPRMTMSDQLVAMFLAAMLSAGILIAAMYYYEFGIFHSTSSLASYLQ